MSEGNAMTTPMLRRGLRLSGLRILGLLLGLTLWGGMVEAGHLSKEGATIFLNGQVLIRFEQLYLSWPRNNAAIDVLRYRVRALRGKATLVNVDYQDRALGDRDTVRWTHSPVSMNREFSAFNVRPDENHRFEITGKSVLQVRPFHLDSARVRFHLIAAGRSFVVIWRPKSGEVYATW